jgi:hypothetical protein
MKKAKPTDWSHFDWLWVELSNAIHECPPDEDIIQRHSTPPWESTDPAVLEVWRKITDPPNRDQLQGRLKLDMNPTAEEYTRKALEICVQRCEEER